MKNQKCDFFHVCLVAIGVTFVIVGAVYLGTELEQRVSFDAVPCKYVNRTIDSAQCPRFHYEGCGCSLIFNKYCSDVKPDTKERYCCSGSCTRYSNGKSRVDDNLKRVTYGECKEINVTFLIDDEAHFYRYYCDDGHRFEKNNIIDHVAAGFEYFGINFKTKKPCEDQYEGVTKCYYNASNFEIRLTDPYSVGNVIWSSILLGLGLLLLIYLAVYFVRRNYPEVLSKFRATLGVW